MKIIILLICLIVSPAVFGQHGHGSNGNEPKKRTVWLDNGLGSVHHPVTTKNPEAQKYFDQGLAYLYAFNHDEGVASFRHAAELDPDLAMAYWGMALGLGANYNDPANTDRFARAYVELQKALALAPKASKAEQDYIAALSKRYSKDPNTPPAELAAAYKAAMADLVRNYPDDLDAATLYAESMMNLRPWQLWTLDGKPAEGTLEIVAVLEGVLRRNPNHTGANHYYIHAIEASPNPERGTAAANRLLGLAPNAGHLVHMPSHIYLLTGDHENAVKSNELAIVADRNYIERSGASGIYPLMYYNHNIHMLAASHAEAGNYAGAIKASNELAANVGPNVKAMPMLEMFMPYPIVTLTRFHKWDEIMKYEKPAPEMLTTTAFWHMARGIALAETGKPADAAKELASMRAVAARIPETAMLFTTPVRVALKVGEELLAGEVALANGDRKAAIDSLRMAAASEAKVNYAEPPDWDLPVREWLGRALMMDGQYAEAEKEYRAELVRNARNGRALFGLAESLARQGKDASAKHVRLEFREAWKTADAELSPDLFTLKTAAAGNRATPGFGKARLSTGITINYAEQGDAAARPLILLHGFTDSWQSFSPVMSALAEKYRVYALDLRGHGDSERPATGYEPTDMAEDVVAFMKAKNIRRAAIAGHSMGSFVAMNVALLAPKQVDRLILIGTATTADNEVVREGKKGIDKLNDPVPVEFITGFQESTVYRKPRADFFEQAIEQSRKVPSHVWKEAVAGLLKTDMKGKLSKVSVPVLILWGDRETVFPRAEQELLLAELPKARLRSYSDVGHSPHWETPDEVAADIKAFLGEQ